MAPETASPESVVGFWVAAGRGRWFRRDPAFDAELAARFEGAHLEASRGEFASWAERAEGALALVLLLDQVPRNIYRGSPHAFATDPLARRVANGALAREFDLASPLELQPFFYLPFEHHEDPASQARAVELTTAYAARGGEESYLTYARLHADLIARFGRLPHRNAILGRDSTTAELAYLAGDGFKG